jgi:UDP-N-acetylglucosamine 4,6-dehydratase
MFPWWNAEPWSGGRSLPDGFSYSSDNNTRWLTKAELLRMVEETAGAYAGC